MPRSSNTRKLATITIYGNQPRKSNSRQVVRSRQGHPKVIKSKKALLYEKDAMSQFTGYHRLHIEGKVAIKAVVYYHSKLSDLSLELIMDVMEKAGVYLNDRQVMTYTAVKRYDKENPRIEMLVSEVEEEEMDEYHEKILKEISNEKIL